VYYQTEMKTVYRFTANEFGTVLLRKRKIAKALRRWLRENGIIFDYAYFTL